MHSVSSISESNLLPYLRVEGKRPLSGQIEISGAKNSALVLMAASLLTDDLLTIKNVPHLTDIDVMADLLLSVGADLNRTSDEIHIRTNKIQL